MTEYLSKILIVDDRPSNLVAMKKLLGNSRADLFTASSGNEALSLVIDHQFALILLDVQMPDMDGFETAELMRASDYAATTPIIFVTAISKEQRHVHQGYASGAVDYLFKPVDPVILLSKVSVFLELDWQKRELEKTREELFRQREILEELSIHDELTGLYNRRHFNEILRREFARCKRYNIDLCCMMLDLDHFKQINDTFGHSVGDKILTVCAHRFSNIIRATDFVFRIGGEEFLILLPQTNIEGAQQIAEKIRKSKETKDCVCGDHNARVTVSIGLSSYLDHSPDNCEELVSMADKALYAAKNKGRNRVEVYQQHTLLT